MSEGQEETTATPPIRLLTREEAEAEDRTFWRSKTPTERWAAAEKLRQIAYGYDPAARISPVIELTSLKPAQSVRSENKPGGQRTEQGLG